MIEEKPKQKSDRKSKPKVRTTVVNLEVWKTARKLAGGHGARLQVLDSETVVVHNNENWREVQKAWKEQTQ